MKEQWIYGGNLQEELAEWERILPTEENQEVMAITHTFSCSAFLTIVCC